jgi:hypothetical protein
VHPPMETAIVANLAGLWLPFSWPCSAAISQPTTTKLAKEKTR